MYGDLVHDPQYWEEPWRFPPQGVPLPGGNGAKTGHSGKVVLPTTGRGNYISGVGEGVYVNNLQPE